MRLPRAILFDMDGTLTEPYLDFPRMKAEMGIALDRPILEALAEMTPDERRCAEVILHRHEEIAAAGSSLNAGCRELIALLDELKIRSALITRNSPTSVSTVLTTHSLAFAVTITRDDAPPKPLPDALHRACRVLGVDEADAWMVGDGQYDVEAGLAAGVRPVWVSHGKDRPFAAEPWRTVRDLCELSDLLRRCSPS
jgi:HAD superfamily hydrolase (TIGR01509 family)